MKVILLKDVKNLGKKNTIVKVNDGYFQNFLSKQKLAVLATEEAIKHLNKDLIQIEKQNAIDLKLAEKLKEKIESIKLEYTLKSNQGNVFGSISQKQIISSLVEKEINVEKYFFPKDFEPLKIGNFHITLNLHQQVKAELHIIVRENNEEE